MASLPRFEFRRRFAQLFEIDPSLTNNEAYTILEANSFDVPKTCLEIAKKTQGSIQEREFWIPKRTLEQLEVSERPEKKVKSSQTPEQSRPNIIDNDKLPDEEVEDSRIPQVKPREIIEIDDSDDEIKQEIIVDDERDIVQNDTEACAKEVDHAVTGAKREFSDIEISGESDVDKGSSEDESDSEIDYGSQQSRSGFDSHMRSLEKLKSAESIRSIKPIKSKTLATRFVAKVAGNLFNRELMTIKLNKDQTLARSGSKEYHEEILSAHSSAEQFLRESRENLIECQAKCRAGDSILVQDAEIESKVHCALIVYLYKENEEPMAHIRYFERGCDTIIGEMASPRVLFVSSRCANISKAEIRAKIRVDFRGKPNDINDPAIDLVEEEYHRSPDRYFYRLHCDDSLQRFSEAKAIATQGEGSLFEECECCALKRIKYEENHQLLRVLNLNKKQKSATGFIYKGTKYQLKDFVYFISKPTSNSKGLHPYNIGQIQNIRVTCLKGQPSVKLTVDNYERYDDHFRLKRSEEIEMNIPFATHDNRRVFRWNSKLLNPKDLDGHCFVRHIEQIEDLDIYKDLDDTFWVQEYIPHDLEKDSITVEDLELMPKEHLTFSKGNEQRLERKRKQEMTKMDGPKLNTLDIYSGAGGLSKGLHESGVVGTSYAIESDTAACRTFAKNSPGANVYNCDAGEFLEKAMQIDAGLVEDISREINGTEMPSRGDIDMIIGGPPCQGWSRANRQNNPKKLLKNPICPMRESIATFLSYVEFYRPKYCLLENVTGLKYHPLNGSDIPNYPSDESPLTGGATKFIFRLFTSLGYQCQYSTLQAGTYGVPSSRNRVIFWASQPGYKLPKFPEPTHVFNRIPKDAPYIRRSAPHRPLTIQHCILDLPLWEFENPHKEIQQTPEQKSSQINRGKTIAQYSILNNQKLVGSEKQDYASPYLCEFQRQARKSVPDQLLHNHVTGRISVKQAERVCSIPLEAGADYRRMNEALLPNKLRKESERCRRNVDYRNRKLEGRFGRPSLDEIFKIMTTAMDQYSTNSWMLNPKLHRPYTLRELARAMGFPDSFIWDLETTKVSDALKQIGNAVPPPFARALGNELRKVLQGWNTSRESEDDEDIVDQEYNAIDDQVDQYLDMVEEIMARSETDSDEEIDDLVIEQLKKEFNRSTDDLTDAGSEDENEKNSDIDKEVSDDSDIDIDADMKDQEDQKDLESEDEDEDEENWNTDEEISSKGDDDPDSKNEDAQNLDTDEEISNESEVEVDEDSEDQEDQEILGFDDDSQQNLDTDEEVSGSDVDVDRDMKDQDVASADDEDMIEDMDSEEESLVNTKMQREERIHTGGSRDDAIVIDDSE
ncbi:uncharacterized protein EAE98_007010 [Botrytis deweyae]|uniref:Cytosine-specific methyltransferase n=1 Tax=Botrytis deweyae TaxID=2478750 RepID=A0ABQ7IHU3_9HELO|nr:uncharacterized protein EAE98_007010 [Botrytis deweyae]KAF7924922.1 hypothetical protein EAE98_007010 [Botrytis deweyae]